MFPRLSQEKDEFEHNALIAGIGGIVNALLSIYLIYFLLGRILDMSKVMGFAGWAFFGFGVLLITVKCGVAIVTALTALLNMQFPIHFANLQLAGWICAGIDLIFVIAYTILFFTLGMKDPSGLTYNLFLFGSIITLLETISAVVYVIFCPHPISYFNPNTGMPMKDPYLYMPVIQLGPNPQQVFPMQNF